MRKCKLKINNKDYTLEMTRDSVKWLEAYGFDLEKFNQKPVTYYDLLWQSLFIANHSDVNANLALKLMESYQNEGKNPAQIVKFAFEEYQSFINALAGIDLNTNNEELEIIEA